MCFEKIGNLTIEDLELKPDYEECGGGSWAIFRTDENISLQAFPDGRVILDCVKNGKTDTYKGTCTKEELEQLKKMYNEGLND